MSFLNWSNHPFLGLKLLFASRIPIFKTGFNSADFTEPILNQTKTIQNQFIAANNDRNLIMKGKTPHTLFEIVLHLNSITIIIMRLIIIIMIVTAAEAAVYRVYACVCDPN